MASFWWHEGAVVVDEVGAVWCDDCPCDAVVCPSDCDDCGDDPITFTISDAAAVAYPDHPDGDCLCPLLNQALPLPRVGCVWTNEDDPLSVSFDPCVVEPGHSGTITGRVWCEGNMWYARIVLSADWAIHGGHDQCGWSSEGRNNMDGCPTEGDYPVAGGQCEYCSTPTITVAR